MPETPLLIPKNIVSFSKRRETTFVFIATASTHPKPWLDPGAGHGLLCFSAPPCILKTTTVVCLACRVPQGPFPCLHPSVLINGGYGFTPASRRPIAGGRPTTRRSWKPSTPHFNPDKVIIWFFFLLMTISMPLPNAGKKLTRMPRVF